ncbi:peptidase [Pinisolibacter sp.]|uniref:peptidase n=1 Tax=Pinisolibacter sp. TaxID=2172024 RepID=UPI002FDE05A6
MTRRAPIDFAEAKPFEIFRTGTHRPMVGEAISFAEADLAAIAAAYDPALSEAPIVVGHPALDAPAYGWIGGLAVEKDRLLASPIQVDAAFAEMVRAGSFKKISASFYRPDQTGNPKPGSFYLRHVGFLGAQPPAVKGLKPVEFGDDDACLTLEFADWSSASALRSVGRLMRGLRDWIIGKDGVDAADRVLPDWEIESLGERIAEISADAGAPVIAYADRSEEDRSMTTATELEARRAAVEQQEHALAERARQLDARAAEFAEAQATRRRAEDASVLDALIAEGRLPATLRPMADALFAATGDLGSVDFAEGDGAVVATAPRELLTRLLKAIPLPVAPGEIAGGEPVDFADPEAVREAIETEISEAAGRGETITAAQAAARIKDR